jgi:hypothetical protein
MEKKTNSESSTPELNISLAKIVPYGLYVFLSLKEERRNKRKLTEAHVNMLQSSVETLPGTRVQGPRFQQLQT